MAEVAKACAASDPARGTDGVLAGLGHLWPDRSFRPVLTRGGCHRSGASISVPCSTSWKPDDPNRTAREVPRIPAPTFFRPAYTIARRLNAQEVIMSASINWYYFRKG